MQRLQAHPLALTGIAFAVAAGTAAAVAAGYGFHGFLSAWSSLHPVWLAVALTAGPLAHIAYAVAYHAVAAADGAPDLPAPLVLRLVAAGFGPFALRGGFAMDREALRALHEDEDSAMHRILGLGSLEWLLLAPGVFSAALILLLAGDTRPEQSMLWPWAIGVPLGFALAGSLLLPVTRRWLRRGGRVRRRVHGAVKKADAIIDLGGEWDSGVAAFGGMGLYWVLDITAFVALIRLVGLHAEVGEAIVAYGTGYALTRRSMPLGGAGVTEALMTFALHWMGQPVLRALVVVILYRLLSFVLPAVPALAARGRVLPLILAGREGRSPTSAEHRRARAPLRLRAARRGP